MCTLPPRFCRIPAATRINLSSILGRDVSIARAALSIAVDQSPLAFPRFSPASCLPFLPLPPSEDLASRDRTRFYFYSFCRPCARPNDIFCLLNDHRSPRTIVHPYSLPPPPHRGSSSFSATFSSSTTDRILPADLSSPNEFSPRDNNTWTWRVHWDDR